MNRRCLFWLIAYASLVDAQQPFRIDTTFRTSINRNFVGSVMPLADGRLVVSGLMDYPGSTTQKRLAALNPDGSWASGFAATGWGGGRLRPWQNGLFYVATQATVRRILLSGEKDLSFIEMANDPYFSPGQGGDYHLYPDGRVLLTGRHGVNDPVRAHVGLYSLIWFTNAGHYDTTRAPCAANGAIYRIAQLPNGQFYCGGAFTTYEGIPAYALARVEADGTLDTTFNAHIAWGEPQALLPMANGGVMVGGDFRFERDTDTLRLVRFLSDGSLDPDFNPSHTFTSIFRSPANQLAMIHSITKLGPNRYAVAGYFDQVDGETYRGIAMFDSTGALLENYFPGTGAGIWTYMNATGVTDAGIMPTGDGSDDYWIWGSYHGYDDGTTNDTLQRMVSRLHGLSVGVAEGPVVPQTNLQISPNPSSALFHISRAAELITVYNAQGKLLFRQHGNEVDLGAYPPGVYTAVVRTERGPSAQRLVVVR